MGYIGLRARFCQSDTSPEAAICDGGLTRSADTFRP